MRICDICKSDKVNYSAFVDTDGFGDIKELEVCRKCHMELTNRERQHKYLAYIETIKARNGEIPHKSHWWDRFTW